jgi:transposase
MSARIRLRDDFTAKRLRQLARSSDDNRQTCRPLAIAGAYEGMSRAEAARVGGMDRQTLREWVVRFNDEGPDGLKDRRPLKRPRRLSEGQMKELAQIVETGPDPAIDMVVRWRPVDLQQLIKQRNGVSYGELS